MFGNIYGYTLPLHNKPVLEASDLHGKDRKAYDILLSSYDKVVDHRKIKWAKRYLKNRGYNLISTEEADKLNAEYEEKEKSYRLIMTAIAKKFPALSYMMGNTF